MKLSLTSIGGGLSSKAVLQAALGGGFVYDVMPILNTSNDFQTVTSGVRTDDTSGGFLFLPGNGGSTSTVGNTTISLSSSGITSVSDGPFYGSSMEFSAVSGIPGYFIGPTSDSLFQVGSGTALTLEGWFYFNDAAYQDPSSFQYNYLFSNYGYNGNDQGWEIILSSGVITFNAWTGSGSSYNSYAAGSALSSNTWYHIAFVWDNNNIKVYRDGTQVLNTTFSQPPYGGNGGNPNTFAIGTIVWDGASQSPLSGRMQDVRGYSSAKYSAASFTIPPLT